MEITPAQIIKENLVQIVYFDPKHNCTVNRVTKVVEGKIKDTFTLQLSTQTIYVNSWTAVMDKLKEYYKNLK